MDKSKQHKTYRIGELARNTGTSVETLRYYESQGLLENAGRSSTGYRFYNDVHLRQLNFVLQAKKVGFSLKEIKHLLSLHLHKSEHTCEEVKQYTGDKIAEVDAKIRDLQQIRLSLDSLYQACCGGSESAKHCSILHTLEDPDYLEQKHELSQ